MSSLAKCIKIAKLHPMEAKKLKDAAKAYRDKGFKVKEANEGAVKDAIKTLEAERADIVGQIRKQLPEAFVEPRTKVAREPVGVEIPTFKTTNEAITFGEKATPEQIAEMKKLKQDAIDKFNILMKQDKLDEASVEATRGQFYKEAYEAAEVKPVKEVAVEKVKEPEYVYHGTGESAFRQIRKQGMAEKEKYFSGDEQYARTYAERKGILKEPRILRIKKTKDIIPDERIPEKGDFKTEREITPDEIEVKVGEKWIPIQQYYDEAINIMPIKPFKKPPEAAREEIKPKVMPEVKPKVEKVMPQYAVKQSISDTDITISDVRKIFKPQHAGILKDGNIWVKLKSGYGFHVKNVQSIAEDRLAFEIGRGRMKTDGEFVAGKFEKDTIEIVRGIGDIYTLSHESEHLAEKAGLITSSEINSLKRRIRSLVKQGKFETANEKDIGGQEDRAKFIETELHKRATYTGTIQRILNKIADWVDSFVNLFKTTSRGVVKAFERGEIFKREAKVKPEIAPAYATKAKAETEKAKALVTKYVKGVPPIDPPKIPSTYEQFKDDWFGNKDWAEIRHAIEKNKLQDAVRDTVSKKKNIFGQKIFDQESKRVDQAIHLYLDLKRNPAHREEYYKELPAEWKKVVDKIDLIETNPKLKAIADYIRVEGDKTGKIALEADVIRNQIENHVNRVWEKRDGVSEKTYTDAMQKFKTKSRHAKHRVFDTILEGLALKDKSGKYIFNLKVKGATANLQVLKDEIARVIEDKKLITEMRKTKAEDGNPLISTHKINDTYVRIEHPNFKVWEFATKVDLVEKEIDTSTGLAIGDFIRARDRGNIGKIIAITDESVDVHFVNKKEGTEKTVSFKKDAIGKLERPLIKVSPKGRNFFITDEGTILEKRELYAPKKIARDLNKILGVSRLRGVRILGVPAIDILTKYNAIFKSWILVTSFFHHQAFLRSYYLPTQHKTRAEWNPFKAYKMGKKAIEDMTPEVELLVRNGLTMFKMQDWEESLLRSEDTIFGKILDKTTATKAIKDKINDLRERQANFLFGNFGAALKTQAALIELRNMTRKHPDMDVQERAKMVARLINDDFGGLHLGRMGRDPTTQHIMRLLLLAPDWTESNVRTMVKAFKSGGVEETAMYRRFWTSALTKGLSVIFVANILMAALDEDDFEERYKKAWKTGHFRWLDIDVTPIYKMFGGKSEARKYFSLFGHFRDPLKFIRHPIRSAHYKGSVVYGIFHEAMAGTDWRGQRFTTIWELIGVDDKGVYLTTTKTHKKGDPKGGKLAGRLTTYGGKGSISLEQVPSYAISQLLGVQPIQIQNLIAMLVGEVAAFDAIARSLGLHTGTTYPTTKSIRNDFIEEYIKLKKEGKSIAILRDKVRRYNLKHVGDEKEEPIKWRSITKGATLRLRIEGYKK